MMAWHLPGANPLSESMMVSYWRIYESLGPTDLNSVEYYTPSEN